jgi:hypothetical protein
MRLILVILQSSHFEGVKDLLAYEGAVQQGTASSLEEIFSIIFDSVLYQDHFQVARSEGWNTVLQKSPETFQFAPASIRGIQFFLSRAFEKLLSGIEFLKNFSIRQQELYLFNSTDKENL